MSELSLSCASLRVFLSAPTHNEPQQIGIGALTKSIEASGYELVLPGPKDPVDTRLDLLMSCDLVVSWIDGLLPKGMVIAALNQVQREIKIEFPPQIQQVVDAGWNALGGAPDVAGKAILLPGETPAMRDSPKSITIGFDRGGITAQLCSPPINLPEGNTLVEAGIAMGSKIPLLIVALGPAAAGDYIMPGTLPMVGSFEALDLALEEIKKADSIVDGLASILQGNIEDLASMRKEQEEEKNGVLQQAPAGSQGAGAHEPALP